MKTAQPLTALSANKHTAQRRMAGGRRLVVLLAGLLACTPAWAQQSFGQAPAQQTMPQNTYPEYFTPPLIPSLLTPATTPQPHF